MAEYIDFDKDGKLIKIDVMCEDNRFELISKYKAKLLEGTNIETSPEEMAVIYNILFRFWQMGWLDKLDSSAADVAPIRHGHWVKKGRQDNYWKCSECNGSPLLDKFEREELSDYCPHCGAKMDD